MNYRTIGIMMVLGIATSALLVPTALAEAGCNEQESKQKDHRGNWYGTWTRHCSKVETEGANVCRTETMTSGTFKADGSKDETKSESTKYCVPGTLLPVHDLPV